MLFESEPRKREHKVRGGSALTAALHNASPSGSSNSTSTDACVSAVYGGAGALAPPYTTPTASPRLGRPPSSKRSKLSFLSCFGTGSIQSTLDDEPSVAGAEVGIRPCFYWLDAEVSAEERMFAEANARWLKSDCQDDVVVIEAFGGVPSQMFVGVFDGHGPYGRAAAKHASAHIPAALASAGPLGGLSERRWARLLSSACASVNASMQDPHQSGFDASLSGTTACFAVICGRRVHIASAGDSRCFAARRTPSGGLEAVQLTEDAKPEDPSETRRIQLSGGVVKQLLDESGREVGAYRVFRRGDDVLPGLAMSRSLGDIYAQAVGVTCEPRVRSYTLSERDLFLVFATDGVCDVMSNEECVRFVQAHKDRGDATASCAEALTLEAQERWKAAHNEAIVDDISVAIVHTCVGGRPPALARQRSASAHGLAHAHSSCNDEANMHYESWKMDKSASHHPEPEGFFDMFPLAPELEAGAAAEAPAAVQQRQQVQAQMAQPVPVPARCLPGSGPPPPLSSTAVQAAQQPTPAAPMPAGGAIGRSGSGAVSFSPPLPRAPSPFASPEELCRQELGLAAEESIGDSSAQERSPRSSLALSDCTSGDPSCHRRSEGGLYSMSAPTGGLEGGCRGASTALARLRASGGVAGAPLFMQSRSLGRTTSSPINTLLPPIRKAYPSSQGLVSYRSDASLMSGDTLLSAPESARGHPYGQAAHLAHSHAYSGGAVGSGSLPGMVPRNDSGGLRAEGKVRGGVPRSLSVPGLHLALLSTSYTRQRYSSDSLSQGAGSLEDGSALAASACTPTEMLLASAVHTPPDRSPAAVTGVGARGGRVHAGAGPSLGTKPLLRSTSEGSASILASASGSCLLPDSPARGLAPVAEAAPLGTPSGLDWPPPPPAGYGSSLGGTGRLRPLPLPPRSPQAAAAGKLFVVKGVHGADLGGSSDSLGSHDSSVMLAEHVAAVRIGQ